MSESAPHPTFGRVVLRLLPRLLLSLPLFPLLLLAGIPHIVMYVVRGSG